MKKLLTTLLVLFQIAAMPLLAVAQSGTSGSVAVLYFSPPGESASTGTVDLDSSGNFSVDVKVNTHGANSAGADVIVLYDTSELQYVSGSMPGSGSGAFYPTVVKGAPGSNTTGRIAMSRVIQAPDEGESPTYTNGNGVFANLVFKPLASSPVGTTVDLSFDYTAGSTTDCNVAGTTTTNPDILSNARDATLTIQQGTTTGLDSVSIAPASATVAPSGTKTFTATAKDEDGDTISSGVTYEWELDGDGDISSTSGSSITYTADDSAGSADVTVTATQGSLTATDSAAITVGSAAPGGDPEIDHIVPGEGDEDADIEIDIYGSNFGDEDGRVYIGTRLADVLSWSDGQITVLVPRVNVSSDTEYQVKVRRADGEEARFMGYTYLAKTGLPLLPWLIMFPLNGAAALLVRRRSMAKRLIRGINQ